MKVVYDGECNLCLATAAKLRAIRTESRLEWIALQSLASGETPAWPAIAGIPPERLAAQLHVTDEAGRLYGGPEAVMRLLKDVPSLKWLGVVGSWPGFRSLSGWLYRLIARYRYQLFGRKDACDKGVCALPRKEPPIGGK
nr:DUF393 domain-containing protein [Cohnella zeiphila]